MKRPGVIRRASALAIGWAVIVAIPAPFAGAQAPAADEPPARATRVLDRAREAYLALPAYRDEWTLVDEVATDAGDRVRQERAGATWFLSPSVGRVAYDGREVVLDGTRVTLIDPALGQAVARELPGDRDLNAPCEAFLGEPFELGPAFSILSRGDRNPPNLLRLLERVEAARPEAVRGVPGVTVLGAGPATKDHPEPRVELWFADATGLLGEVRVDASPARESPIDARTPGARPVRDEALPDGMVPVPRIIERRRTLTIRPLAPDDPPMSREAIVALPRGVELVERFEFAPGDGAPGDALVGSAAPDFSATDAGGTGVSLRSLRGEVVVLNFWATWCKPCIAKLPEVEAYAVANASRGVKVLFVNIDDELSRDAARRIATQRAPRARHVLCAKAIAEAYGVAALPKMVVIDRAGRIRGSWVGPSPYASAVDRALAGDARSSPARPSE